MGNHKKWRMDYSRHPKAHESLEGVGETVVQVVLVFIVLFMVYAFFDKTEPASDFKLPLVKTYAVDGGISSENIKENRSE